MPSQLLTLLLSSMLLSLSTAGLVPLERRAIGCGTCYEVGSKRITINGGNSCYVDCSLQQVDSASEVCCGRFGVGSGWRNGERKGVGSCGANTRGGGGGGEDGKDRVRCRDLSLPLGEVVLILVYGVAIDEKSLDFFKILVFSCVSHHTSLST
ncbi:uncharacterized protein SEPMUDRAFT_154488 [Sphaerulina musiva SO2202]|uniref:Uncharacterized protein n=1 Tax=Sphaerulina musiva (strain SO2202) TaxID=692275 RepID=M3DCH0_SPHMS|nr:uncharacterized protein SEPMUDRAFT_154488 [Sphaerulina musiva SO2202]EMF15740.1 hypothetical protein SEPMUDRAFT_154488 [Sphaerulina musiva SO2202]